MRVRRGIVVFAAAVATIGLSGCTKSPAPPATTNEPPSSASLSPPPAPQTPTPSATPSAAIPLCQGTQSQVSVYSESGAAGTIYTVWRILNATTHACSSYGYPGMDFHVSSGWLNVTVQRESGPPFGTAHSIVVSPGLSMYFLSAWSDVDTAQGPCRQADKTKVTLPNNFTSVVVGKQACLQPSSVRVGPMSTTPPAS